MMSNESEQDDLISNLPDHVISHILSRLPAEDAVRTSVLSKDWEYKWTYIPAYAFYDRNPFRDWSAKPNFAKFVERALNLSQNMQSFRLRCSGEYDLLHWILTALNRGIYCLEVECYRRSCIILPCSLLTSYYSLRELRLAISVCAFRVPEKVCFSNLTTLDLTNVTISKEQHSNSDRVEFNLPLLEKLKLSLCKWLNIKHVEIHAPKMTSLGLLDPTDDSNDCSVKISGKSLEKVTWYAQSDQNNIAISGLADVVYASLEHYFGRDRDLRKIIEKDDPLLEKGGLQLRERLNEFSSLKELELWGDMVEVINKSKLGPPLPRYYKLEKLIFRRLDYAEGLIEWLHAMPYLKLLGIYMVDLEEYDYEAKESIPSCIVSHLEKVIIDSFTGKASEINLIKFLLKNASHLKSLAAHLCPRDPMSQKERHAVAEQLSTYPKASTCLNLAVEEWDASSLPLSYEM